MTPVTNDGRLILSGCLVINEKKELLLLFRDKHNHYETPGGKVEHFEYSDPANFASPSVEDLKKTAERELTEELGNDFKYEPLKYFGAVEFTIPDGRLAIANKFITKVLSGTPKIAEPTLFSKLDYLAIKELDKYPISPDLILLFERLKKYASDI
jgi:ADP-ribose pyrophosphatase YjhB (NUDIX family)